MTVTDVRLEGWLSGDLPASEMDAFQAWLRSDPQNRRRFLAAVALDQDLRAAYRLPRILRLRPRRWRVAAISAAGLVFIGVGLMLWKAASPPAQPAPVQVVCGWSLSDELVLDQAPAPEATSSITAPQGGELRRAGFLVLLQPGAKVVLSGVERDDGINDLHLSTGRLIAGVQEEPLVDLPASPPTGTVRRLSIDTACGSILLEAGSKVELASASFDAPSGPGQRVDVLVLAGSVAPPDLGPRPIPPKPLTTGNRIQLTRIGEGPVQMKRFPSSQ